MTEYDFKKDLPYIGKETKDKYYPIIVGNPEYFNFYSSRPDYKSFKSKIYNTEIDCVSVLIGLTGLNIIDNIIKDKQHEWIVESEDDWKNNPNLRLYDTLREPKWQISNSILFLFSDIETIIEDGCATQEIGKYLEYGSEFDLEKEDRFTRDRKFHSLSFLKWASLNGFPIPDELRFHENKLGQLEYVDPVIYGELERSFPKHPTGKEKIMDPLYVAMKAREALIDLIGGNKANPHNYGARDWLDDWIEKNYPKISKRQRPHIISIVNDGHGRGKGKI